MIYCKYVLNKYKSKKEQEKEWYVEKAKSILDYYYLQDVDEQYQFICEIAEYENIDPAKLYDAIINLPRPKNLSKRRNGMILADNGHWEEEV